MNKVIYYTETYFSTHGGSTHAREFFNELSKHERISEAILFPSDNNKSLDINITKSFILKFKITCIEILRFIIPVGIKNIYKINFPPKSKYKRLYDLIKLERPDILIIRHSHNFKFLNLIHKDFSQLKVIVEYNASPFSEGMSTLYFSNLWRKLETYSLSYSYRISVVSRYLKDYLVNINPDLKNKIIVNPNGVDLEKFKLSTDKAKNKLYSGISIPTNSIVFGYIGGMEKFRRLPEVVERFALLRQKGYNKIFLMLIGNGTDLENVIAMSQKYKESLKDHFYCNKEWVLYKDIPTWLNIFDVGIFPFSNSYGSPQKIFEYLACELPVLGPDVPALTIGSGRELCSELVKQDGSNFEEKVHEIYFNLCKKREKAKACRIKIEQNYTWKSNLDRILNSIN